MTSPAPVPPQPTLVDGAVTLRPWAPTEPDLAGAEGLSTKERHAAYADDRRAVSFVVEADGVVAGAVTVTRANGRDGTGRLSWSEVRGRAGDRMSQALRALAGYGFEELGLRRVEVYADVADRDAVRIASRAGLRKEGVVRGYAATGGAVLLGRLADDPDPFTREGFVATLNAGLPTKRAIAQALIRNERGEVLVCELVYKNFWDLPGGVVDPGESPAHAVVREIREELRLDARIRSLATVSWLPPWHGWDDATLFLFDVEVGGAAEVERAVLEPREIRAVHWVDEVGLKAHAADYTARLVARAVRQLDEGGGTAYLENGIDPDW
ncbi:NUDIX hydrolase [Luteipulveratus flavus]|uniref:GNAT family N-acetyltransferase n=1 Tax=Luteipulveratus flavus TaxID=3031728 RepID=A0ABT6CA10_9MICO|nr:GNAT family N-acetyltransferase [Luteipulveratus sp. YIM 133296]MDF8265739.1 GNAT family N-acetyltransferase [Luteipulveratus sp. YIM 133296]